MYSLLSIMYYLIISFIILFTLHVIIIPGGEQVRRKSLGTPRKKASSGRPISTLRVEFAEKISQPPGSNCLLTGTSIPFPRESLTGWLYPPGHRPRATSKFQTPRVNRTEKINQPSGADFSILPSGYNYDM